MSMILDGTNGATFNDGSLQAAAASPYVLKNRIINGDMVISQRNGTSSVTPTADSTYTLDRWKARLTQASKFSVQQNAGSVTPPAGFSNYLGCTSLAATSLGASDYYGVQQDIEGFNTADLGYGTASAATITISFWVRSSLTGTFGGFLSNAASNRFYVYSYTISSANTWEKKTVTITGDTTGTWVGATNGIGLQVFFSLGAGSTFSGAAGSWSSSVLLAPTGATSVVGTNGATFYITGVQLEIGSTATPFERRIYGQELANCQRYYYRIKSQSSYNPYGTGWNRSTSAGLVNIQHPTTMRTAPTSIDYSLLSSTVLGTSEALVATALLSTNDYGGTDMVCIDITSSALFTTGFMTLTAKASTSSYLGFSAEL